MKQPNRFCWFCVIIFLFAISIFGNGCDDDDDDDDDQTMDDDATDDDATDDDALDDDALDDDAGDDDTADDDLPDGCITGDFTLYFGIFHSHSSFSDGKGRPPEAYAYARDEGELDVFALTDHLEYLYIPVPPDKYARLLEVADEFDDPGSYVALAGFEYSLALDLRHFTWAGHSNVFFSPELFTWIMLDYHEFFEELLACPQCLASFNHPGWDGQTNWDGFTYVPEVDPQITTIELSTWDLDAWPFLFEALDQGWHVSPTWNQDNHERGWGTEDDTRTGVWLDVLTRDGVYDALLNRRTFSTLDRNADILLTTSQGCWMGSDLRGTQTATLIVEADDPDAGDGFAALELWGRGEELLAEFDCDSQLTCHWEIELTLPEAGSYVLARAVEDDGDLLVSAPIWLGEAF
ncbi:MAG TPA: hypothetical protein PKW95_19145 [bacterium]|nr:hypothetical protein [bacterium]